jgi:hypothetical protein
MIDTETMWGLMPCERRRRENQPSCPALSQNNMPSSAPVELVHRESGFTRGNFFCLGLVLAALFLNGCQWVGFNNHVTPQVRGRVLDAGTCQPLSGVKVLRVLHGRVENPSNVEYGAQLLQQGRPVTTDGRGIFVYPSKNYFTLLKEANWWSLELSFQAAGYVACQTNFSTSDIKTNLPDGTPLVEAGDILLKPLPK